MVNVLVAPSLLLSLSLSLWLLLPLSTGALELRLHEATTANSHSASTFGGLPKADGSPLCVRNSEQREMHAPGSLAQTN